NGLNPADYFPAGVRGRLRRLFWGHLVGRKLLDHQIPVGKIMNHRGRGGELPKIELGGWCGAPMASRGIGPEEWPNGSRKSSIQIGIGVGGARPLERDASDYGDNKRDTSHGPANIHHTRQEDWREIPPCGYPRRSLAAISSSMLTSSVG